MRINKSVLGLALGVTVLGGMVTGARARAFANLDFELAGKSSIRDGTYAVDDAIPGWAVHYTNPEYGPVTEMEVGSYAWDSTLVALSGPGAVSAEWASRTLGMQGKYYLHFCSTNAMYLESKTSAITQSGLIPSNAKSIRFLLQNASYDDFYLGTDYRALDYFQVFINDARIDISVLSVSNNIYTMVGDISAYAGQQVELKFQTTLANTGPMEEMTADLDAISFSSTPAPSPEPGSLGLLVLGAMGLGVRRGKGA